MKKTHSPYHLYGLVALVLLLCALAGYFIFDSLKKKDEIATLTAERAALTSEMNQTKQSLLEASATIEEQEEQLNDIHEALDELQDDYRKEKNKNEDFEDQISKLAGTVGKLDKLSKTDEELLQKYSKVYFLNENFIPSKLRQIDSDYVLATRDLQFFHGDALPFLEKMLDAAAKEDLDIKISSAYRSFDQQAQLKGQYTQTYGTGANAFSADQGYSEHQLGTTADLSTPAINGPYTAFENTPEFAWLEKNAYKYGFILSYPKDNGYYVYEPWHWRFVGEELAKDLQDDGANFYDWEQRKIDEYLISIFD